MMKQKILIMLTMSVFMSACNQEINEVSKDTEPDGFCFSPDIQQQTVTRGKPIDDFVNNPDDPKQKNYIESFKIWGFVKDAPFEKLYNCNVKVFGSKFYPCDASGKYVHVKQSDLTDKICVNSLASDRMEDYLTVNGVTSSTLSFNYVAPEPISPADTTNYGTDAESLREIFVGSAPYTGAGINEGRIPIRFYHVLVTVRFHLDSLINKKFTIKGIRFVDVLANGQCQMTHSKDETFTFEWKVDPLVRRTYYQKYNNEINPYEETYRGQETEEINNILRTAVWMLIPQTFSSDSSAHIEIDYTNYGVNHTLSIPLAGVTWEFNNEYWYIISKNGVIFNNTIYTWEGGVLSRDQYIEPGIYW